VPIRVAASVLAMGLLSGCSVMGGAGAPEPAGTLVLASGSTQGVYYAYAQALAGQLTARDRRLHVQVVSTPGSVENVTRVAAGRNTCALTADDTAAVAVSGTTPFSAPLPIAAVARVYDDYTQLVVRRSEPVRDLSGLRGRTVSLGARGSGTALLADRVLTAAGMSRTDIHPVELGLDDSISALESGRIDAFFWSGGVPTAGVERLASRVALRLVPLADSPRALRVHYGLVYRPAAISVRPYGLATPVQTVAIPNLVVCRRDTDDAVVRLLVSTIFAAQRAITRQVPAAGGLDRRAAIETAPVPLHPAALRWFRDTKI
jgi:uncharacterized protein